MSDRIEHLERELAEAREVMDTNSVETYPVTVGTTDSELHAINVILMCLSRHCPTWDAKVRAVEYVFSRLDGCKKGEE
jgi:hypothetical protein